MGWWAVKALAISALAGAVAGFGAAWFIQAGYVDAAEARTDIAIEQKKAAQYDLEVCKQGVELQNAAIAELEEKARKAAVELYAAKQGRAQAESRADEILQERTPADQNACAAAQSAFDAELRQERGQ